MESFKWIYPFPIIYSELNVGQDMLGTVNYKKAEMVILRRIEKQPDDVRLRYSLAQIQWLSKQKGEAKKNYAR